MTRKGTVSLIVFRAVFVTSLVLLVTGITAHIGPFWSGILASFPINGFPLYLILAHNYGEKLYPIVFRHLSYSFSTLCLFYLLVSWLFPILGIYLGILVIYAICLLYLLLLSRMKMN